jgi:serine phosphatase RsbU (regulator of sigma subunit)/putative methionine-R-sulfoxide reductase with GAF domain
MDTAHPVHHAGRARGERRLLAGVAGLGAGRLLRYAADVALPPANRPEAKGAMAGRLRDIEAVADAALSRLDEQSLLAALLERVKNVLHADTAAVLLVDHSARQLVATAASGIEEEVRQGVRIPLGAGFAGRVAASRQPVILATVDHTTVRNPLLVDRGIKSLLGVPLFAGGNVIGVLHVGSLTGRTFSQPDIELLQLAADRAAGALHSLMSQDDALAAVALHRSLLPDILPDVPGTGLAARYVAGSGNVGGDWYDVFTLPDGKLGIVVGDVAGSGLAAAVIMGRMRSTLRAYILQTADPAQALRMLDRKIQYFEPDAMATVLYGLYDPGTGELVLSSAGHLPPVLAAPGGHPPGMVPLQPGPPIGTADDPERHSTAVTVPPGALLCCFTDGLVERRDQPIDHGISQVAATLGELATAAPGHGGRPAPLAEDACAAVMRALVGNAPAQDDIAVLTLHRHRDAEPDATLPQRPGLGTPRSGACQWRAAGASARSGAAS